jgi:uncharacterized membrane protein YjgN (DUF898 family)
MEQQAMAGTEPGASRRIEFGGRLGPFLAMQIINVLLTVITFGIYRFWAKARVRRWLWGRTEIDGDALEYTGTGGQLFIGALLAAVLIFLPLGLLNLALQALARGGANGAAALIQLVLTVLVLWLFGVGSYRGLRYLLSRSSWRGIRGGMVNKGWGYGLLYLQMTVLQIVTLGFATPYASVRLWNAKWGDVMVGTMSMTSDAQWRPLMRLFLVTWLIVLAIYGAALAAVINLVDFSTIQPTLNDPAATKATMMQVGRAYAVLLPAALLALLAFVRYHARYYNHVVAALRLETLGFRFDATTRNWLRYYIGTALWVTFTFGLGLLVLTFRHWRFVMRHLVIDGSIDPDALRQSELDVPGQGEGIADALGVSVF